MRFYYKAFDKSGASQSGELEARSRELAVADLLSRGLTPTYASDRAPQQSLLDRLNSWLRARQFGGRELAQTTVELAGLLTSGFSLDEALDVASTLASTNEAKRILGQLRERVRAGEALSEALQSQPKHFPSWYQSVVKAAEATGDLSGGLSRLGAMMDRSERIKERVRSALIYPVLLLFMIGIVMAIMLTFVIPAFEPFFEDVGTELPLATRIVLGLGAFVGSYGIILLPGLLLAGVGLARLLRRPALAMKKDHWLFRTRLLFGFPQKREVGLFCRTLGSLLGQGVELQAALGSASEVTRNQALKASLERVTKAVREGATLGSELAKTRLFPEVAVRLVRLGEESGTLAPSLLRIADLYETQVDLAIERLLAILVPALTILMGLMVAGFIGSILVGLMAVTNI